MIKDFNKFYYCPIRKWRLFKHYNNYRQIVKKYFTDSATEFRDWNNSLKFHKEFFLTLWSTFGNCVKLKQSIYQWVLNEILQNFQHLISTIHYISFPDWWIYWENKQCHQMNIKSFQQLKPDKLSFFTVSDIINNKELCYLCNKSLFVFFTSQCWGRFLVEAVPTSSRRYNGRCLPKAVRAECS